MAVSAEPRGLDRPEDERSRLDRQHATVIQSSQLLFHPSLGDLSQFRRILDCGAGSPIWVRDILSGGSELAKGQPVKLHPDCKVEACDIDERSARGALPKGLKEVLARTHGGPFKEEHFSKYDFINQHFWIGWVKRDQWVSTLKDLKDILKPGGVINLRKVSVRWDNPGPAPFTRKYEDMAAKVWGAVGYHHNLADELPDLLREAGFVDVQALIIPWPLGAAGKSFGPGYVDATLANAKLLLGHDGVVLSRLAHVQGHPGIPTLEEAKHIADGMLAEVERIGASYRSILVVAKKPAE